MIGEDSFVQVQFGAPAVPQFARAGVAKAWPQAAAQPAWVAAASSAGFLASLAGQGWQVPGSLPGGLPLYAAASAKTTSGEVVDLEYSDGLNVVSLFVQRGTLAASMPGWQPVSVDGQRAFVSGHSVAWAGARLRLHDDRGRAAADGDPGCRRRCRTSGSPGFLGRLGRGFDPAGRVHQPVRLARLVAPTGRCPQRGCTV